MFILIMSVTFGVTFVRNLQVQIPSYFCKTYHKHLNIPLVLLLQTNKKIQPSDQLLITQIFKISFRNDNI